MNDITNKEIIDKLIKYFQKHDREIIDRLLANLMIDINRIDTMNELSKEEKSTLVLRTKINAQQLRKFAKEGDNGKMMTLINTEDL